MTELLNLKKAPYTLKVKVLRRPEYTGARKVIDDLDMNNCVLNFNSYNFEKFDVVVMGVNPVINIIVAALLEKEGKKVLVSTNRIQDSWDYKMLFDLDFQKNIAQRFKTGFKFLSKESDEARTLSFLEMLFKSCNSKFTKSQFIVNSDIALSSHMEKWENNYIFQSIIATYSDKLPFKLPVLESGESLYNRMYNLFYKEYSSRGNNWNHATNTLEHKDKFKIGSPLDEFAYYYVICPKVILTSHYHPYLKDSELLDDNIFQVIQSTTLDGLNDWMDFKSSL